MLKSFLLDIAKRDNSPIILVVFETIQNAGIIENVVMKSALKSKYVDCTFQTVCPSWQLWTVLHLSFLWICV